MRSRGRDEVQFGGIGRARTGGFGVIVRTYTKSFLWDIYDSSNANVAQVASYVAYGDGVWIASNNVTSTISRSTDRVTWTTHSFPHATEKCGRGKLYGNGVFLCFGHLSNATARSTDGGVTWSAGGTLPTSPDFPSIWYGDGVWMGIGSGSAIPFKSTDDGVSWSSATTTGGSIKKLVYCNGVWIAAQASISSYKYSTDNGTTWNTGTFPNSWVAIAASDSIFMVLAPTPYVSTDGVNWTSMANGFLGVNGGSSPDFCSMGGKKWFVPRNYSDPLDYQMSDDNGLNWYRIWNSTSGNWISYVVGSPDGLIGCYGSGGANKLITSRRNLIEVTE